MPVVWSDRCRLHEPGGEIWIGLRTPGSEVAARADAILAALADVEAKVVKAKEHSDAALHAVHDSELLEFLRSAWDEWIAAGLDREPGQDRVVPYVFAHTALTSGRPPAVPSTVGAKSGYFAYDTMTLIGPGTWDAARAAADAVLTAVDLVAAGAPSAYACCRPPGHHVLRGCYGGSCYLNNAAVAAAAMVDRFGGPTAVLDIDAHHGNGTQEIFYERADVLVGSVHVDPAAGWFPHFLGFVAETGAGAGAGANKNLPLPPGAGDEPWLDAVHELAAWARAGAATSLIVPLGVDAAATDPESPLRVTATGFRTAGRLLGELGLPTVLVQEGGYELETLGQLVREVLLGVEEGAA
jgi:acetoin utilization deacetylase AcuC-like enzyme